MGHYYQDPNGYLMMAAIMTLFDTAAFGIVGLLVILRPRVMEWWLMLVFDVLAFAAAIGAGKVSDCHSVQPAVRLIPLTSHVTTYSVSTRMHIDGTGGTLLCMLRRSSLIFALHPFLWQSGMPFICTGRERVTKGRSVCL